ncbi:hypothetical protein IEE_05511 [Bacillus cereus BAG5X1-1]|uniref:Replication-associated protein n=1 Tax=Bacillus cereus BAG5X1-1 TaxID=1053189 RepID=J7ZHT9_BACCE|nr:hypothetical protein [Bacillus cereus]EJQ35991.1 hypothetical protein IEE_05511 [Bacillus cereus BAG5X1-1]
MSKELGFFGNKGKEDAGKKGQKNNGLDINYKPDIPPTTPYDPSVPVRATLVNGDKRGTIRMPLETKQEFDALLEISEYQYTYELLGEMLDTWMKKLTPEQLRLFHSSLENIKRKAAIKEAKKSK